jgi:hypothetical protein
LAPALLENITPGWEMLLRVKSPAYNEVYDNNFTSIINIYFYETFSTPNL